MYCSETMENWEKIGDLNKAMFEISGKENISNGKMWTVRK